MCQGECGEKGEEKIEVDCEIEEVTGLYVVILNLKLPINPLGLNSLSGW